MTLDSGLGVFVDDHALNMAASLEVTVVIADGVDTAGIDIDDAIRRYKEFHVIEDRAFAAPGKDWDEALAAYLTDELAAEEQDALREFHGDQLRMIGHSRYNDQVVSASASRVVISGCVDTIGTMIRNDGDLPIYPAGGGYYSHRSVLTRASDGQWVISDTSGDRSRRCDPDQLEP